MILPRIGSKISWFGTEYIVRNIGKATGTWAEIIVRMNNGIELTLWWTNTPGCKIL